MTGRAPLNPHPSCLSPFPIPASRATRPTGETHRCSSWCSNHKWKYVSAKWEACPCLALAEAGISNPPSHVTEAKPVEVSSFRGAPAGMHGAPSGRAACRLVQQSDQLLPLAAGTSPPDRTYPSWLSPRSWRRAPCDRPAPCGTPAAPHTAGGRPRAPAPPRPAPCDAGCAAPSS